jgi:hypothetical protein
VLRPSPPKGKVLARIRKSAPSGANAPQRRRGRLPRVEATLHAKMRPCACFGRRALEIRVSQNDPKPAGDVPRSDESDEGRLSAGALAKELPPLRPSPGLGWPDSPEPGGGPAARVSRGSL